MFKRLSSVSVSRNVKKPEEESEDDGIELV